MAESNAMIIRPFCLEDQEEVLKLWSQCNLLVAWNNPERDIHLKLQVQPELFLVGTVEDQIVATAMAGFEGHRGWLNYVAVAPAYRRRGLGKQIVLAAVERLQEFGCPKVNLQIRTTNQEVQEFYRRLGFTTDDVVSMGKRLDEHAIRGNIPA